MRRGEIWLGSVTSAETRGSEQHHDNPRPWLIVSHRSLFQGASLVVACPLTSSASSLGRTGHFSLEISEDDLNPHSGYSGRVTARAILVHQIRVMSADRFGAPHDRVMMGTLKRSTQARVDQLLVRLLALDPPGP